MSIPITVARLTGLDPDAVRSPPLVLFARRSSPTSSLWTWRGGDWVRAAAWAALGLLLATAWLLPWYLIWPLPLAAISRDRPLQLYPRPDRLPARRPHPALGRPLGLEDFGRVPAALRARCLLLGRGMQDPGGDAPALAPAEQR